MEKIAVIGFGGHVEKNIIPVFNRSSFMEIDSIYVRDIKKYKDLSELYGVSVKSVDTEIEKTINWVYISTPISTHFELIAKYIEQGKNVICEKPLTTSKDETCVLFDLAESKGVSLYEVCMYKYHKQYDHLVGVVADNIKIIKSVRASFTIPHLSENDIRYNKKLAGGALLDVGFYPVSLLLSLFGTPNNIKSFKFSQEGYEVDLSGVTVLQYDSFYCVAEWCIGSAYSNEVTLSTENQLIRYKRIFSKPETFVSTIENKLGFAESDTEIGEDDQFLNMFKSFLNHKNYTDCKKESIKVISVLESIR